MAPEAGSGPRCGDGPAVPTARCTGSLWEPSSPSEGFCFSLKKRREVSKGIMASGEGIVAGRQAALWCDGAWNRRGRAPGGTRRGGCALLGRGAARRRRAFSARPPARLQGAAAIRQPQRRPVGREGARGPPHPQPRPACPTRPHAAGAGVQLQRAAPPVVREPPGVPRFALSKRAATSEAPPPALLQPAALGLSLRIAAVISRGGGGGSGGVFRC